MRRPSAAAVWSAGLLLLVLGLVGCMQAATAHRATISPAEGRRLFITSRCGHCHTMAAAQTRGGSGPDFDASERLNLSQIRSSLVEGANGMPSYAGRLTSRQLDAIATFIFRDRRRPR